VQPSIKLPSNTTDYILGLWQALSNSRPNILSDFVELIGVLLVARILPLRGTTIATQTGRMIERTTVVWSFGNANEVPAIDVSINQYPK